MSSFKLTSLILRTPTPTLSAMERIVLIAMADRVDENGRGVFLSTEQIAVINGITQRTVRNARKVLEDGNWIIRSTEGVVDYYHDIPAYRRPVCYRINVDKIIDQSESAVEGYELEKKVKKRSGEETISSTLVKISRGEVADRIESLTATSKKRKNKSDSEAKRSSDTEKVAVGMDWVPSEEYISALYSASPILVEAPETLRDETQKFITRSAAEGKTYSDPGAAWISWMSKHWVSENAEKEVHRKRKSAERDQNVSAPRRTRDRSGASWSV